MDSTSGRPIRGVLVFDSIDAKRTACFFLLWKATVLNEYEAYANLLELGEIGFQIDLYYDIKKGSAAEEAPKNSWSCPLKSV